ncbi:hypothetical protein [Streptomyces erythrochromogenes]|uniref:hypothetical protein n=1 Tax=Streptomyces erythrochromogenes TaxID=285574 RepID=UPI00225912A8|nr:hypothetical protein [Streptomyces erythrochromogenes]MCX5583910.1 hypothetical protein [Streptomyces erythrochromogenes]
MVRAHLARLLRDGGRPRLAERLALRARTEFLGTRQNWPDTCRAAVVALRRHLEQEVREAAYATVVGENWARPGTGSP